MPGCASHENTGVAGAASHRGPVIPSCSVRAVQVLRLSSVGAVQRQFLSGHVWKSETRNVESGPRPETCRRHRTPGRTSRCCPARTSAWRCRWRWVGEVVGQDVAGQAGPESGAAGVPDEEPVVVRTGRGLPGQVRRLVDPASRDPPGQRAQRRRRGAGDIAGYLEVTGLGDDLVPGAVSADSVQAYGPAAAVSRSIPVGVYDVEYVVALSTVEPSFATRPSRYVFAPGTGPHENAGTPTSVAPSRVTRP